MQPINQPLQRRTYRCFNLRNIEAANLCSRLSNIQYPNWYSLLCSSIDKSIRTVDSQRRSNAQYTIGRIYCCITPLDSMTRDRVSKEYNVRLDKSTVATSTVWNDYVREIFFLNIGITISSQIFLIICSIAAFLQYVVNPFLV